MINMQGEMIEQMVAELEQAFSFVPAPRGRSAVMPSP